MPKRVKMLTQRRLAISDDDSSDGAGVSIALRRRGRNIPTRNSIESDTNDDVDQNGGVMDEVEEFDNGSEDEDENLGEDECDTR